MSDKHVSNHLSKYRKEQKITQQELAEMVEVSRQTIISIEKGNYTPSVLLALKIAKALSTHIDSLFYIHE